MDNNMAAIHHALLQARLSNLLITKYPTKPIMTELSISTLTLPNPEKWPSEWRTFVKPDVAVYKEGGIDLSLDRTVVKEIPDMVIEILSPQQYVSYLVEKAAMFFEMGVKSVWVVVPPSRTVNVFIGDNRRNRPYSPEFPNIRDTNAGLSLNIKHLFNF